MLSVPFYRGYGGTEDQGHFWETVGSGRRVERYRKWVREGTLPEDWRDKLGIEYVEHVLSRTWVAFGCPDCQSRII